MHKECQVFKTIKYLLVIIILGASIGCSSNPQKTFFGENLTIDEIKKRSFNIQPGMTKAEVQETFGILPGARSFKGSAEALTYCGRSDWDGAAIYYNVWLFENKVISVTNYRLRKSRNNCGDSSKAIDWGQIPADLKIAIEKV